MVKFNRQKMQDLGYYEVWKTTQEFFNVNFCSMINVEYNQGYKTKNLKIGFKKSQLCHLLGVRYKNKSAISFWNDLKNNRLDWDLIAYSSSSAKEHYSDKMRVLCKVSESDIQSFNVAPGLIFKKFKSDVFLVNPDLAFGLICGDDGVYYFNTTLDMSIALDYHGEKITSGSKIHNVVDLLK